MKRFGIRMTLPPGDPMRAAHLLGDNWEGFRWFDTQTKRNAELERLRHEDVYYRRGDRQSVTLETVDR
jgi:hypothetical protein